MISHHLSTNRADYASCISYIAIEHRRSNIMTGTGSEFMWDGIAAIQCTKLQRVETLSMHRASPAISIPHPSPHGKTWKRFLRVTLHLRVGTRPSFHATSSKPFFLVLFRIMFQGHHQQKITL